jgi:transposase
MARRSDIQDKQWLIIQPLLPKVTPRPDGKGRPRRRDRDVLDGILWLLRTGARWQDLPDRYPAYQTCHRRFQEWARSGVLRSVLEHLARDLETRGRFKLAECFIDATFVVAKKGAPVLEKPSEARVRSSWQWQTALVFLSPSTRRLLAHMKSPLSKTLSPDAILVPDLRSLLGILRMTATGSIEDWLEEESNSSRPTDPIG